MQVKIPFQKRDYNVKPERRYTVYVTLDTLISPCSPCEGCLAKFDRIFTSIGMSRKKMNSEAVVPSQTTLLRAREHFSPQSPRNPYPASGTGNGNQTCLFCGCWTRGEWALLRLGYFNIELRKTRGHTARSHQWDTNRADLELELQVYKTNYGWKNLLYLPVSEGIILKLTDR